MSKEKEKGMKEEIIDSVSSCALRQPQRVYLFVSLNSINLAVTAASLWVLTASPPLGKARNNLMNTLSDISAF